MENGDACLRQQAHTLGRRVGARQQDERVGLRLPHDLAAERVRLLAETGVTILHCQTGTSGRIDLTAALRRLSEIGLTSVLSEGGSQMAGGLLKAGLVDRLAWHRAPLLLGDAGLPAVRGLGIERLAGAIRLRLLSRQEYAEDVLETYEVLSSRSEREIKADTVSSGTSA
jgi:riboflavin biosynthesis pyrimidine reductase